MGETRSSNVERHANSVSRAERERGIGQTGLVVWLTGLSGSGKSTIAMALEKHLVLEGSFATVLDGDNLRHGLCGDLGFSQEDRAENVRRVGEVARLFYESGAITLCAFVSPTREVRDGLKASFPAGSFIEVHVSTGIDICESRDPKGLYKRARQGEIKDFTGISAPYEAPLSPHLKLDTETLSLDECVEVLAELVRQYQERRRNV